ncbi:MAG TPA: tetratricopeptide repeat protein [Anaeromyxobacteraceae bacterium]|nr:tetratricopeptide repeat protein [Anaeromyxobacteraceae bacterium]
MDAADLLSRTTLAELRGIPAEIGAAIADLAAGELAAGRLDAARAILEGLVVTNPRDAGAWALLAETHRRGARPLAARFCAEVAHALVPGDPAARLARAEALLAFPDERLRARSELAALAAERGAVGDRARALAGALGA